MGDTVRLTVVEDEGVAEVVCGLLRLEGIPCYQRATDIAAEGIPGPAAWREILVFAADLGRARELLDAVEPAVEQCGCCGRPLQDDGGWYQNETGELEPYCGVCAERVFGPQER